MSKRPEKLGRKYSLAAMAGVVLAAVLNAGAAEPNKLLAFNERPREDPALSIGDHVLHHVITYLNGLLIHEEKFLNKQQEKEAKTSAVAMTPAQYAAHIVTSQEFEEWSKVDICEEGGNWYVYGKEYSGGLGISDSNWITYGGQQFTKNASTATPDEQIVVAMRIQSDPPDQNGCDGSW